MTATLGVHSLSAQVDGVAEGEDFTSMSVWTGDITIVLRPSLTAAISADHVSGKFPLDVIFTSAVSGGKPSYTYSWIFGDGGTSTLANPTHTFATSGDFTVSLNVTDQLGHTVSSEELQITVSSPSTLPIILLIGALGAVIVAIVVVVVVMKSKKKESQPPAQPPIDSS